MAGLLEPREMELPFRPRFRSEVGDQDFMLLIDDLVIKFHHERHFQERDIADFILHVVVPVQLHGYFVPHVIGEPERGTGRFVDIDPVRIIILKDFLQRFQRGFAE